MEQWVEAVKKYGVTTGLVLLIPFMLPYFEKYLDARTANKTEAFVYKIKGEIIKDIQLLLDKQTAIAIAAHTKTKLTDKQALYIMKTVVGYQSIHKVNWLRTYLSTIPKNNIEYMERAIKQAIKAELVRQSSIYVEALNGFANPKLGLLGNFVNDNFDMDGFLEGIYAIVFNNECLDCDLVYEAIMYFMLDEQNKLWEKAEERMKK